jgi:hypothetical protein
VDLIRLSQVARQISRGFGTGVTITGLKVRSFLVDGKKLVAIEQNPNTSSFWAQLAQKGNKVVQFKDSSTNKYVAVSVNGNITEYH